MYIVSPCWQYSLHWFDLQNSKRNRSKVYAFFIHRVIYSDETHKCLISTQKWLFSVKSCRTQKKMNMADTQGWSLTLTEISPAYGWSESPYQRLLSFLYYWHLQNCFTNPGQADSEHVPPACMTFAPTQFGVFKAISLECGICSKSWMPKLKQSAYAHTFLQSSKS